jgi:hypothetical protein
VTACRTSRFAAARIRSLAGCGQDLPAAESAGTALLLARRGNGLGRVDHPPIPAVVGGVVEVERLAEESRGATASLAGRPFIGMRHGGLCCCRPTVQLRMPAATDVVRRGAADGPITSAGRGGSDVAPLGLGDVPGNRRNGTNRRTFEPPGAGDSSAGEPVACPNTGSEHWKGSSGQTPAEPSSAGAGSGARRTLFRGRAGTAPGHPRRCGGTTQQAADAGIAETMLERPLGGGHVTAPPCPVGVVPTAVGGLCPSPLCRPRALPGA